MSSNTVNTYTTKDSFPASTAGTGTITTEGVKFTCSADNGLSRNDWIYSPVESKLRKIISFIDHTDNKIGRLEEAFPSDLAAEDIKIVKSHELKYFSFGLVFEGGAGEVDNESVSEGISLNFVSASVNDKVVGCDPIVINPDGNTAKLTVQKFSK